MYRSFEGLKNIFSSIIDLSREGGDVIREACKWL